MFIRKVQKKNPNSTKRYVYFRLVESYRGAGGKPRQRVVLNLGTLEGLPVNKHKLLADKIEHLLLGQTDLFHQLIDPQVDKLANTFYQEILQEGVERWPVAGREPLVAEAAGEGDFVEVDLDSVEHEDVREIGSEWLCKQVLDSTGIGELLQGAGIKGDGLSHCLIAAVSRLVHPASELATETWLKNRSGLAELYGMRNSHVSRFQLYNAANRLFEHKDLIERHLASHTRDLFSLEDRILLFDLTNTYFEGRMEGSKKAAQGRSKEKRSDAPLVSIALVTDHLGFPKYSRFHTGNISEPSTLKDVIGELSPHVSEGVKPIVVIDAGIATEENRTLLRGMGYDYLCVSRSKLRNYEAAGDDVIELQSRQGHRITVKDLKIEQESGERILYVRSPLKAKKESAMKDKLSPRFEADMEAARAALGKKTGTKTIAKVHERIGRIKQRHLRVAGKYDIETVEDKEKGVVTDLKWTLKPARPAADTEGVYFLRTSVQELSETVLWRIYSTLTEIENVFRTLKTDLSIRPVFHQTDHHIESHLFLGILAYHIVAIIRYQLSQHGLNHSWKNIIATMDSQKVITTTFNDRQGQRRYIRQCSRPRTEVRAIYDHLGLKHQPFTRKKGVVTQL